MGSGFWLGMAQGFGELQEKKREERVATNKQRAKDLAARYEKMMEQAVPEALPELHQRYQRLAMLDPYDKKAEKTLEELANMPLTFIATQKAQPAEAAPQFTVPKAPLMKAGGGEMQPSGTNTFSAGPPKPPRIEDVPSYTRSMFPDQREAGLRDLINKSNLSDFEAQSALNKARTMMPVEVEKATQIAKAQAAARKTQYDISAAKEGYKVDDDGNLVKIPKTELSESSQSKLSTAKVKQDLDEANIELRQAQAALARMKADPNSPLYKKAQLTEALATQRLNLARANFYAMNYGTDLDGNALPGSLTLPDGTAVGRGFQANVRPTTPTRQMAETVEMLSPKVDQLVAKLEDPVIASKFDLVSRNWSKFQLGTFGVGDPDYMAIRNAVSLMQTAELRAHIGARGGQLMLAKFESLNNTGNMNAETLKWALLAVKDFLSGYSDYVFGATGPMKSMKQPANTKGGPTTPPPPPPPSDVTPDTSNRLKLTPPIGRR